LAEETDVTQILAAIDNSPAARPVIDTAVWLGRLLGVSVAALHVREDGVETASAIAATRHLTVNVVEGDTVNALIDAIAVPDVLLGVVGARGAPSGRRPAGHVALAVAQAVAKPLIVVPPESVCPAAAASGQILVAVDDAPESGAAAREAARMFAGSDAKVVLLHVFEAATVPRFWDQAHHAGQSWSREFLARRLHRADTNLELRSGAPGVSVLEVADEDSADLIVLSWAQDLSIGRAKTVQDVLTRSRVPVLLMPVGPQPAIVNPVTVGRS
jgi:nucleotide-binding universal stress UspA family protein